MIYGSMRHDINGRKKKFNAWKTKKPKSEFKEYVPPTTLERRDPIYPSFDNGKGSTTKIESPKYTGTLVKGISTMHKSNAVPIIDKQELIDHARMRR